MRDEERSDHERKALLRFTVIAPLLAAPPPDGELQEELSKLAQKTYTDPVTGAPLTFGRSTIERWYYAARHERDPVLALRRKVRKDKGLTDMPVALQEALRRQHEDHPSWDYKLHHDNLVAHAKAEKLPTPRSYPTLMRFMKKAGLIKERRRGKEGSRAEQRSASHERRSFEVEYVHGLGHLDFHECSRVLMTPRGELVAPRCFAVLDDRSRLACHVQWYWHEEAQTLAHGLMQAILKRGLMRRLMMDGGGAMKAEETREGLSRLGVQQELMQAYSPEQNGKQEHFWVPLERRLMAMLEGVPDLTLEQLNEATQAWVEMEYNRRVHGETGETPLERFSKGPSVGRPSPALEELQRAFRVTRKRTQRRSDGTISIESVRFEVPSRFRTMPELRVRYARWDLRSVTLIDPDTDRDVCPLYPLDRQRNADGRRAALAPVESGPPPASGVPAVLRQLLADYAARGLPPAYLPLRERDDMTQETCDSDDPSTEET